MVDIKGLFGELDYGVLDHGFVRIIDVMGSDDAVVQAARVSYGAGTKTKREDAELINYLLRHKHTSPFEMCEIKLHLKMPIFVARQWIRHRTASLNEYSCRYSEVKDEMFLPDEDRLAEQSKTNKQGSGDTLDLNRAQQWYKCTESVQQVASQAIQFGEKHNVAREINRINMTVAHYTEFYWKIDLHNLLHFLRLRLHPHAQKEIRDYAEVIGHIVSLWMPATWEAFLNYTLYSETFSYKELAVLSEHLNKVELAEEPNEGFSKGEWREFKQKLEDVQFDWMADYNNSKAEVEQ
jgi:thymidylate synthase (FAD)